MNNKLNKWNNFTNEELETLVQCLDTSGYAYSSVKNADKLVSSALKLANEVEEEQDRRKLNRNVRGLQQKFLNDHHGHQTNYANLQALVIYCFQCKQFHFKRPIKITGKGGESLDVIY